MLLCVGLIFNGNRLEIDWESMGWGIGYLLKDWLFQKERGPCIFETQTSISRQLGLKQLYLSCMFETNRPY